MRLIDGNDAIDINSEYTKLLEQTIADETIEVNERQFSIVVLRLRPSEEPAHHLHYFADRRQVTKEALARSIPNLAAMYKIIEGSRSAERPDIVIFNHPIAVSEGDSVGSVVILEFKRPMRQSYQDDENPLEQVLDYMAEIREKGQVKNLRGRPVTIPENCPFYATVLCDVTQKI